MKVPRKLNMNYQQARYKFGLSPYGDADRDRVPNYVDCRPYNKKEQGLFKRAVGIITKDKYGQTAEEYAAEKAMNEQLKSEAAQSSVEVKQIGTVPSLKETAKKLFNAGSPDPGVEGLRKVIYGTPRAQTRQVVTQSYPDIDMAQLEQGYPVEDEYTYKSYYHGRPGYLYLPSVRRPRKFRPRPEVAVNPFKRAKEMERRRRMGY